MGSTTEFYQANPGVAMVEMQRLVRAMDDQAEAERRAYEQGWADCGLTLADYTASMWKAGYEAAEKDMDAAWKELARKVRAGAEKAFPTWEQKRAMELENCKPRPTDFPGLDNDPHCLDRMKVTK